MCSYLQSFDDVLLFFHITPEFFFKMSFGILLQLALLSKLGYSSESFVLKKKLNSNLLKERSEKKLSNYHKKRSFEMFHKIFVSLKSVRLSSKLILLNNFKMHKGPF